MVGAQRLGEPNCHVKQQHIEFLSVIGLLQNSVPRIRLSALYETMRALFLLSHGSYEWAF